MAVISTFAYLHIHLSASTIRTSAYLHIRTLSHLHRHPLPNNYLQTIAES